MNWYAYHIPPIDFNWQFLSSVTATQMQVIMLNRDTPEGAYDGSRAEDFERNWHEAQEAARKQGWEGDFRHDPVVFWLPDELEFSYGFVFKQDNNGSTFVVSPKHLPWLERIMF